VSRIDGAGEFVALFMDIGLASYSDRKRPSICNERCYHYSLWLKLAKSIGKKWCQAPQSTAFGLAISNVIVA
jgi:hypothetical protein